MRIGYRTVMKRRSVLGTVIGGSVGLFAGCADGDEPGDPDADDGTGDPSTDDDIDDPAPGDVTYSVEPAATEIEWGERYSVAVTARAGSETPTEVTIVQYQRPGDTRWTNLPHTRSTWDLEDGESRTVTHDIEPPASGEITFRLIGELSDTVAAEWQLLVVAPIALLGEPISYYDGLELAVEAQIRESMEFTLVDRREQVVVGTYPVRPKNGQWVVVTIAADNTNVGANVGVPDPDDVHALSEGTPLERPRTIGDEVGDDPGFDYEIADETAAVREGWFDPRQEAGFYDPPRELIPGAAYQGWSLFEADADIPPSAITVRVNHRGVWATWE